MSVAGGRKLILVVEDNPADVKLLAFAFQQAEIDCELVAIDDGAKALEFVRNAANSPRLPDLAILDLNLPKHDGLEILEAMRANCPWDSVPVIVFSSSSHVVDEGKRDLLRSALFVRKAPELDEYLKIGVLVKELLVERQRAGTASATT